MASYAQTIIAGHLGREVESRFMTNGEAVCNFSVAVTESWKSSDGTKKESTVWYRVVAFKKLAEICTQYLKKGSAVLIVGKMTTREWEKDGVKREAWELRADSMQLLGAKPEGQRNAQEERAIKPPGGHSGGAFDDFEDSIPF